jgi:hypothetical protein
MEIRLTPEEMFIARCDWEKQSSTGTKVFSEFIAQAQLRKVVKAIENDAYMPDLGHYTITSKLMAALREAAGETK